LSEVAVWATTALLMTPGQDREFRSNEQQQQAVILSEVGGWE